ncbi:hypothetical protein TpMuguga_01g01129 [Theileria parva strain Muguga]|uniref:Uncharacterized protein n=1 Tax=Theileria parva TaxID=5875 RepID=Q4N6P1_THEPA|nr:uncharacterized protein TpMuguga_01g01129 [Theileria parva strain Muguga]EAN34367.1 hypothetical protein TpMuguga_01g01129 [Theileria parva strain Muguga]|eukprot:XP_766650.1 hypothetical protein [Theileria parva strain Muguga]
MRLILLIYQCLPVYRPRILLKNLLIKLIFNNDMSELLVDSSISDDTKCVAPSDQLASKEGIDKNSDDVKTDNNVESTSDDAIIGPKKTTKTVSFSNKISFHYF